MAEQKLTTRYRNRFKTLFDEASDWRAHWRELNDYVMPRKGRYLQGADDTQNNDGRKKHQKIINGRATDALDVLAAGLQGGLTSPSRPWFVLEIDDDKLMESEAVKVWLHEVRDRMLDVLQRSNFYASMHSLYAELGLNGTTAMLEEEDFDTVVRFRPFTIGEFYLALNAQYRPVVLYRQFAMTAEQLREEFGEENLSDSVKTALVDDKELDRKFEVIHAIEPNTNNLSGIPKDMKYESIYFQVNGEHDKALRVEGYREMPFVAPRWKVTGVDTYGGSRGMDALGDIKMLQKIEEKKLKGLDKSIDPPMNAPTALKSQGGTIISGGVNYLDVPQGMQGFSPVYQVKPDLQGAAVEIANVERRIERFFFNDLFLSIINQTKNMTATEVAERHSERLLILGPVLERLQSELLDVIIERTYSIMDERGDQLPEVPQELEGRDLKIEYISILAQAQKEVGTGAIEKTVNFVGAVGEINPEALDKLNVDEAIEQYGKLIGAPPKVIRSKQGTISIRKARADEIVRQQQAETAQRAVEGAKTLSDTKVGQDSMLDVVGEAVQGSGGELQIPGA